ncbi:Glycosaminoglycan xylosylkinase [Holothuria leucospilota]|uniref:Glycosaminoglycan xylosylkinase n=1 Tax=Holothuria leucospilota TaxID=206669 RepID=A0A9Q1C779_HOLLE|nr:Glycosaminoglycan xylosylkinase [Holothuria leucospilota]
MFQLLNELATASFANVSLFDGGTQVKFKIQFTNGNFAIAKPMRHARDRYWAYNQSETFWFDRERHNAEIAAFHLDSIIPIQCYVLFKCKRVNFTLRRLPTVTTLCFDASFLSSDGEYCFIGNCEPWFCNKENPVCSQGKLMELSICQLVHPEIRHPFQDRPFPWSQGLVEAKM